MKFLMLNGLGNAIHRYTLQVVTSKVSAVLMKSAVDIHLQWLLRFGSACIDGRYVDCSSEICESEAVSPGGPLFS